MSHKNRKAFLLAAALLAAPSIAFAEEDAAKGAVDPYDAGAERTRFLAAAGVDSELDEKEFNASKEASEPFARKYDSWATIKGFDRNGNNTIDWFEADGYRKALRDAVLLAFDKDKDGKLADAEREAANKELAAGKAPRVAAPRRERPTSPGDDTQPNQPRRGGGDNENPAPGQGNRGQGGRGRETPEQRAEALKKYDADGDGELSREERQKQREDAIAAWREANPEEAKRFDERRAEETQRREAFTKKYDKDGNGELSREEVREGMQAEWKERDPEGFARFEKQRADFLKKYDADGNGELSDEERRTGFETVRKEAEAKMQELTKKYDKDGDGRLNREEREAITPEDREGLPFFGGPGGPGGPGGRGQGGPGGQGGQRGGGQRGNQGNNAPRGNDL